MEQIFIAIMKSGRQDINPLDHSEKLHVVYEGDSPEVIQAIVSVICWWMGL